MTKRIALDAYMTKSALTMALTHSVQIIQGSVLEPCSGRGDMANALAVNPYITSVHTNDINPEMPSATHLDSTKEELYKLVQPDWVVTNPPFSLAHFILPLAIEHARVGAAFLLRLSYLEPTMIKNKRGSWLQDNSDSMVKMLVFGDPRPKYREDTKQTDSVTTMWAIWDKRWSWRAAGLPNPFVFITGWDIEQ